MGAWFKQNMIFVIINTLILIIMSVIGWNVRAMVLDMDNKVDKDELKLVIDPIAKDIEELKLEDENIKKFYLDEIRLLRQDLKLKVDKP